MNYYSQYHDSISTVQLSPFGEVQWNRIVTYSPIYVHWTDMLLMSRQRTNKTPSGKLNVMDRVDLNTMKLEDEILLNELYRIRRAAATPSPEKIINPESKVSDEVAPPSTADYQLSSGFFPDELESNKHHCSYAESSVALQPQPDDIKHSVVTNRTTSPTVNGYNQTNKLPNINFGPKPQPSLGVQLRQSAIAREHVLSTTHDRHIISPLSISSSKRITSSANLSQHHHPPPPQSVLSHEVDSTVSNAHKQLTREPSILSARRARARSINSSRTTMHMLKTKNDRTRQKQNIELKTLLVEPQKQKLYNTEILNETIPNSLEIMHKMCGPATPFERNLRYNFRRQLNQFRHGTTNSQNYY